MTKYVVSLLLGIVATIALVFNPAGRANVNTAQASVLRQTPQVENKTQSLKFVSLTQSEDSYILKLRNASNKDVNGYSLGGNPNSTITTDFTIGSKVVVPDEVIEVPLPISNFVNSSAVSTPPTVAILAVFFTDGTAEGVPSALAETKARRLGVKIQIQRVRQLVKDFLASKDVNTPEALNNLKARIASLPEEPEAHMSPRVGSGLRSAKEDVLREIEEAAQTGGQYQDILTEVDQKLEKRLKKLAH
ncbi:MAG TPA: hypothetical protein VK363_06590 [Pyrinomonadaceae bacterium]|nr:hypothetical protein [Pyrinomonadaceae bacterium]